MQAPYLLSGSFAYDTILLHTGEFHTRILPEALSRLNVSFGVDEVHDEFGGTGGNIAYNAGLLGMTPLLVGSVGSDGQSYLRHLAHQGHRVDTLTQHPSQRTPHAWILTDTRNNQITGFNLGALVDAPAVPEQTPQLWHLSPENVLTMAALAKRAHAENKTYFFDPGQVLPSFIEGAADQVRPLADILTHATGLFVNDYEAELLESWLKAPLASLIQCPAQFIIRTRGAQGVDVLQASGVTQLPVATPDRVVDPTGCGDAFRAGFLSGFTRGWAPVACAELGAVMGSFAVECTGGQNHHPERTAIEARLATFQGVPA